MADDSTQLWKKIVDLEKGLKEANRLHKILDEYCTEQFKEAFSQILKQRDDLTKVATAMAGKTPAKAR
jgi:hypothetical protein